VKKGKAAKITISGTMKEYEDIEKVVVNTYLFGVRLDRREVPYS
jgi:hypothetical protein